MAEQLRDLHGVGPAALRDFALLGIRTPAELRAQQPHELYQRLCHITGQRQDPCVLDVFCCAVAPARDSHLPPEQKEWSWWSRRRKEQARRAAEDARCAPANTPRTEAARG